MIIFLCLIILFLFAINRYNIKRSVFSSLILLIFFLYSIILNYINDVKLLKTFDVDYDLNIFESYHIIDFMTFFAWPLVATICILSIAMLINDKMGKKFETCKFVSYKFIFIFSTLTMFLTMSLCGLLNPYTEFSFIERIDCDGQNFDKTPKISRKFFGLSQLAKIDSNYFLKEETNKNILGCDKNPLIKNLVVLRCKDKLIIKQLNESNKSFLYGYKIQLL